MHFEIQGQYSSSSASFSAEVKSSLTVSRFASRKDYEQAYFARDEGALAWQEIIDDEVLGRLLLALRKHVIVTEYLNLHVDPD